MVQARRVIANLFFGAKTISLVEPCRFTVLTSKPALQHTRLEQKHSCRRQKHRNLDCQHACRPPSAHMLASSADVLEALACVLEVQADGREDQNRPRNRKNQQDNELDGPEQQAVDQSVKNPAEQAEKKASAIRADEAPELAQEVNHSPRFCRRRWKAKVFLALR